MSKHNFLIPLGGAYSAAKIAVATAIVSWIVLALTQTLPFIPTATSYAWLRASVLNNRELRFNIFLTRLKEQVKSMPSELKAPNFFSLPWESTHTSSGSISLLATKSFANTRSPTWMSGRFFFVAPSNARYERDACSLAPISTLKISLLLCVTIPTTFSPRFGI